MNKSLSLLLLIPFGKLCAQDTSATKNLNEVVITSQYKPQSIKNSVYQVRVVTNERIRTSGATTVQQVLTNQLGFRFSNDNTLGTTDVQLLGMSGRNVKILLDGVPMIDRGDTRESLAQVDINTIDRIEIVEGPMSVSFGSDALAGVINIITKKPGNNSFSVNAKAQEETAGKEYYPFSYQGVHTQSLSLSVQKMKWNFSAGGNHNDFDGFGGDDYGRGKNWRPKEQWMGHARIGYSNQKITAYYRLDGLNEKISNRQPINFNNYKAIDQYYSTQRYMHQLHNNWQVTGNVSMATILSYTDYKRSTKTLRHDFTTGNEQLTNGQGEQDVAGFNSFIFRNTVSWIVSPKISLQPGIDINHEKADGARISGNPSISDYAVFVSSEIKPTAKINIRPGLRFIKNSVYNAPPVIPSINTKFALNKNIDWRLAYAYGFRSPALRELYFNFIDANHIIVGNPNLKAEYSNSYSTSLTWSGSTAKQTTYSAALSGFYNVFNNLINYATSPTSTDTTITVNIDKFKTTGATLETKLGCKNLSATLGFSYIGRYNALSEDAAYKNENLPAFTWTPEINSNLIFTAKKINTSFAFFYKYSGKRPGYAVVYNNATQQDEVQLTKIEQYHWADITVTKPILKYLIINAGIKNLFDVTNLSNTATDGGSVHGSAGPVSMSYGRSYFMGVSFHWTKK